MPSAIEKDRIHKSEPRVVSRRTEQRIIELLMLRAEIKRLHAEADELEFELLEEAPVGVRIPIGTEGSAVVLKDNFADGNVCFRPAAVRQFEFTTTK